MILFVDIVRRLIPLGFTFAVLNYSQLHAQAPSGTIGNWMMLFGTARLSEQWGVQTDLQARSYALSPNMEQLMLRGGIDYYLSSSWVVTAGYAYVTNWDYDKDITPDAVIWENRIWEQLMYKVNVGSVALQQRIRLEQRFLANDLGVANLDRIRIQLRASIPIGADSIKSSTFFITAYDEFFTHAFPFSFDRNRLYGALAFQFNPSLNFQLGMMVQTTQLNTRLFLQLGLYINIDH